MYQLRGGDVFLTFPDEPHSTGGKPSEPGVLYWLNVRRPAEGCTFLGLPEAESQTLLAALDALPHRHFRATQHTKTLFRDLFRWHDSPGNPARTLRLRLAVTRLLLDVIDASGPRAKSPASERISEIIRLTRSHPERDFRLDDLARHARLSLSHFKKRFRAETGLSPRQFILRDKIEAAKRILHAQSTSVTDIALDLGFVSSQYFATVFKRITGMTPSRYRECRELPQPSQRGHDGQS
jgi:AraC-like DNA-binding protein